jgi:hypothetical protein
VEELGKQHPGCYQIGPPWLSTLWIAANELPLVDELTPFLIARSGKPLDAFVRWVMEHRSRDWLLRVLEFLPMSNAVEEELRNYTFPKTDDPVLRARQKKIAEWALESSPEAGDAIRLQEARAALRNVLKVRQIALRTDDETCIEGCTDLATLKRWLEQAVVATSTAEALR